MRQKKGVIFLGIRSAPKLVHNTIRTCWIEWKCLRGPETRFWLWKPDLSYENHQSRFWFPLLPQGWILPISDILFRSMSVKTCEKVAWKPKTYICVRGNITGATQMSIGVEDSRSELIFHCLWIAVFQALIQFVLSLTCSTSLSTANIFSPKLSPNLEISR